MLSIARLENAHVKASVMRTSQQASARMRALIIATLMRRPSARPPITRHDDDDDNDDDDESEKADKRTFAHSQRLLLQHARRRPARVDWCAHRRSHPEQPRSRFTRAHSRRRRRPNDSRNTRKRWRRRRQRRRRRRPIAIARECFGCNAHVNGRRVAPLPHILTTCKLS